MKLRCPKCKREDVLQIERRINGDITCMNCGTKGKHKDFNIRTQDLDQVFKYIDSMAENGLRVGQIFAIIDMRLKEQGKMLFYIENDVLLHELGKILPVN